MNKIMMGILVAVCILGMALIMLNERLSGTKSSSPNFKTPPFVAQTTANNLNWTATASQETPLPEITPSYQLRAKASSDTLRAEETPQLEPKREVTTPPLKEPTHLTQAPEEVKKPQAKPAHMEKNDPIVHPIAKTREDIKASAREKEKETALVTEPRKAEPTVKAEKVASEPKVNTKHTPETANKVEPKQTVEKKEAKEAKKPETAAKE
ncbi:MAG: hypothetical protein IJU40_05890, partial [Desulfovibrionaceae bacterium]|nr:hypothetical protein [Desulfovibrionaceae bacterium]